MLKIIIINVVLAFLSTYLVVEYFQIFFEKREKNIVNRMIIFLYFVWQALALQGFEDMSAGIRLVFSVISVLMISFCFKGFFLEKVVFAIIYNAIWMLGELLIGSIFLLIGLSIEKNENLGSILSKIMLLFLIKALQRFFEHESIKVFSWKNNVLLLLLPLASMFITYHLFMLCDKVGNLTDKIISIGIFISILVIDIVTFIIYIKISDGLELKRKNSIYQLEIDLYNEQIKEKENAMINFQKSRHDLKNKLIFLLDLVKDKKMSEAQTYIEELIDLRSLEKFGISHSGNSLIDALVNYKYDTAKRYAINFQVRLDIPVSFSLANSDLCIILGNALDNAIEANMSSKIFKPYINLKMKYDQGNLVIIIENSFDGIIKRDERGNIISRKQDMVGHGIGVTSIQNAVIKYNGYMNTEIVDKIFKVIIVMHSNEI